MNEQKNRRKKKMNKLQREKLKAIKADEYNEYFSFGYKMGYEQALKDLAKENGK